MIVSLRTKTLSSFVEKELKELRVEGISDFFIKEKIKLLKGSLKMWNKDVFGWFVLKV